MLVSGVQQSDLVIYIYYIYIYNPHPLGFPDSASSKEPTCQCRRHKRCRLDPWVGKIPCRRKRQPTSVFLLGNPMNRGAWESTVHRVAKSWTRLKRLSLHACIFFFQVFFPCRLLQNIEYSSLGCTVGPFFLSILYIVVCIC